jgi:hypothetical protein
MSYELPRPGETLVQMYNRRLEEQGRVDVRWTWDDNGNFRLVHTGKPQPSQAFMGFMAMPMPKTEGDV